MINKHESRSLPYETDRSVIKLQNNPLQKDYENSGNSGNSREYRDCRDCEDGEDGDCGIDK